MSVKWCPGHCNIEGNELADSLAKAGFKMRDVDDDCTPTAYGIKAIGRRITKSSRQQWWSRAKELLSARYREWDLGYDLRCPAELAELPRRTLHRFLAIGTGHGDFTWYHEKFRHEDAKLECSCGQAKTPDHLVHCRKALGSFTRWPRRPNRRPGRQERAQYLEELMKDPKAFKEFIRVTKFFSKICT